MVEYKQLPKSVDGKCLLCKRRLSQREETVIFIYDENMKNKKIMEKLFLCPSCRVKYANSDIFTHIRINNKGYRAIGFMPDSKSGSAAVMQEATSFPENFKKNRKSKRKREVKESFQGFDIYPIKGRGVINNVYAVNELGDKCIICNRILTRREIQIPVRKYSCVHYKGKSCGEHLLVKPVERMIKLMNENQYARHIKMNYDYFFRNYSLANKIFSENESYLVLLFRVKHIMYLAGR